MNGSLSFGEKVGYALGDTASNLYWKVFEFFLLVFYTDVMEISPTAAGTLFLVTRLWDAITDPAMGVIADKTRTRWGRYRPWIVWMALPMAVAGILTFTTPDLDQSGRTVWAFVTYTLMMTMYTMVNIPYSALMGVITPDSKERTEVSSYRFVGAFSGAIFVQFATLALVNWLGGGDTRLGWQLTMVLYGVLASGLFFVTFSTTTERVEPIEEQQGSFWTDLGALAKNDAMGAVVLLGTVVLASLAIRGAVTLYYLQYYVAIHEMQVLGFDIASLEVLVPLFLTSGGVAGLIGIALTTPLSRLVSKRRLYIACMGLGALLTLGFYVLPGDALGAIFLLNLLVNFVMGPTAPLTFAMFADVADYGEWKTGRRTTGLVFSGAMLSQKIGVALGGLAAGLILDSFGYIPNQAQTDTALTGILLMVSVIPAALAFLGVGAMALYPLEDDRMVEIGRDLQARRDEAAA